jgi:hypothetical protein
MLDFRSITIGLLASAALLAGCEDGTGPGLGGSATIDGRVEQTTPPTSAPAQTSPSAAPQRASGASAQSVAVVQVESDGRLSELATAQVAADGSFSVEGVPAGRSDLAVVAYAGGEAVGSVLVHEESRARTTIVVEPINAETTLEARAYSEVRASSSGSASTSSELSLLVRADGSAAQTAAGSQSEIDAVASAYSRASATLTAAYSTRGVSMDARARAEIIAGAAADFATMRYNGATLSVAHDAFTEAALEAMVDAGADLEAMVMASAAAGSTFDAALQGTSSIRGTLVVQPVRMNLRARERLAASLEATAEGSVALAIRNVLSDARTSVLLADGLIDLRAVIGATLDAVVDTGADACVELLASGASASVRDEVRIRAETALRTARLGARLESATTAQAAVAAMADYKATVHAAVEAMIEASGTVTASADVLTTAFIAASGGAYIH